jgi:hypothetical protein
VPSKRIPGSKLIEEREAGSKMTGALNIQGWSEESARRDWRGVI